MDVSDPLRRMLLERGASWVGFADLGGIPAEARREMPRGVCIAVALNPGVIRDIANGPTPEYYAEYCRVNSQLTTLADEAAAFLRGKGFKAWGSPATVAGLDRETLWTPLPHKTVATRAGFGWIGKCALLVTERFGSAMRITSVVTDADLPVGLPITESRCGECTACVDACPAGAPSGKAWSVAMKRGEFFDAFACCKSAGEQSAAQGIPQTICGRCIAVCPWTKKHLLRAMS